MDPLFARLVWGTDSHFPPVAGLDLVALIVKFSNATAVVNSLLFSFTSLLAVCLRILPDNFRAFSISVVGLIFRPLLFVVGCSDIRFSGGCLFAVYAVDTPFITAVRTGLWRRGRGLGGVTSVEILGSTWLDFPSSLRVI